MTVIELERPKAKTATPKSWRDTLPVHPAADIFPMMTKDEIRALADDIKEHGLWEKVSYYYEGKKRFLLDGRNRAEALELLGRRDHFDDGIEVVTDPYAYVITKNIHRRHLNVEDRQHLLITLIARSPEKSNRQLAKEVGVTDKTIAKARSKGEQLRSVPQLKKRTGADGKSRPATKPTASKSAPAKKISVSNVVVLSPDQSAKALSEFKFAANTYWPRMTKKHHGEAIAFIAGLSSKLIENAKLITPSQEILRLLKPDDAEATTPMETTT